MKKISLILTLVFSFIFVFTGCTRGSSSSSSSTSSSSTSSSSSKTVITGITFDNDSVVYDGNEHSLSISGTLPTGVETVYSGNSKVNVGTYEVTVTFTDTTDSYIVPSPMTATLTITPAEITGITFTGKTVTYDGQVHSLEISGTLPTGVTVAYTGNDKTEAGTYEVTATFTDTTGNYIVPSPMTATLVINAPAHEHTYGAPTYTWSSDNSSVTATRVCSGDSTHIETETVATTKNVTQQQSCTSVEKATFTTVAFANPAFTVQTKTNVQTKPAAGHSYGEPTYVWADDYSTITASRVCSADSTHSQSETIGVTSQLFQEQTCTLPEITQYRSTAFKNPAFALQMVEVETKPAAGHTLTHVEAKPATDYEDGNIEHWTCTCGEYFLDAEGKQPTTKTEVIIPSLLGTSLVIKSQPTKVEYNEGEYFDPTGLVIEATTSGNTITVPTQDLMISASEALIAGTTSIKVEYNGAVAYIEIKVNASLATLQDALVQTAYAYYYQQTEIQYDQRLNRRIVGVAPEVATAHLGAYLDCSSFVFSAFNNAFGENPFGSASAKTAAFEEYSKTTWEANGNKPSPTVLYYVNTQDYTTAEAQKAILDEVRAALQPGDFINYRHGKTEGSSGHVMMYVGNDTFLHSTGTSFKLAGGSDFGIDLGVKVENPAGSYDGATGTEKSVGSVQTLEADMLFDAANSGQKRYLFYKSASDSTWTFSLVRPLAGGDLIPTADARARMANPGLDIEKIAATAHMSTVVAGEEITYSIRVSNKSSNAALTNIEVKDIISESVTYVDGSINNSGIVSGNEVSWNVASIAANSSVTLSYKVKVNDDVEAGTKIDSSLGTVEGIKTNEIWHTVGSLNDNILDLMDIKLSESVGKTYADSLDFVKDIYSSYDDTILDSYSNVEEVLDAVIDAENFTTHTNTEASKMLVEDLWGGIDFCTKVNKGRVTNFKTSYFEVGDLIVVHNAYQNAGYLMYVYTDSAIYTVENGKVVEAYTGSEIASFLVSLYGHRQFAILRPSHDCAEVDFSAQTAKDYTVAGLKQAGSGELVNVEAVVVGYVADNVSKSTAGLLLADETTKDLIIVQGLEGEIPSFKYTAGDKIEIGDKIKLSSVVYFQTSPSSVVYAGSLTEDRPVLVYDEFYSSSVSYVSEGHSVTLTEDTVISDKATWETALNDISMYQIIKFEASPENKLYVGQSYYGNPSTYPITNSQAYFHYNGDATGLSATKYDIKVNGTSINAEGAANIGISKFDPLIGVQNHFGFATNNASGRPTRVNYSYGEIYGVVTHITTTYVLVTPVNTISLGQGVRATFDVAGGDEVNVGGLVEKGSTITFPTPTKGTSTFLGWSDGTNVYQAGNTYTVNSDVTFTALWTDEVTYAVTFVAPGASNIPTVPNQPAGDFVIPTVVPTIENMAFAGWSDGTTIYQAGDTYQLTGATTFTAVFEEFKTVGELYDGIEASTIADKSTVQIEGVVIGYVQDTNTPGVQNGLLIMDSVTEEKIAVQGFLSLPGNSVTLKSTKYYTTDATPTLIKVGDKISLANVKYYANSYYEEEGIQYVTGTTVTYTGRKVLAIGANSQIKVVSSDNNVALTKNITTVSTWDNMKTSFAEISMYDVFTFEASSEHKLYVGQSSSTASDANGYLHYNASAKKNTAARVEVKVATDANSSKVRGIAVSKFDAGEPDFGFVDDASNRITGISYTSGSITVVVVHVTSTYVVVTPISGSNTLAK